MPTYKTTINSVHSAEDTFSYMARFDNAVMWDPGTESATMATNLPLAVGSKFNLNVKFLFQTLELTYTIIEYKENDTVVLQADETMFSIKDTIKVSASSNSSYKSQLIYTAELQPKKYTQILDLVFKLPFFLIGSAASKSLNNILADASKNISTSTK